MTTSRRSGAIVEIVLGGFGYFGVHDHATLLIRLFIIREHEVRDHRKTHSIEKLPLSRSGCHDLTNYVDRIQNGLF